MRVCWIVLVAVVSGLAGGAAATAVRTVHAQENSWPKTLKAEQFVVVDEHGNRRAELGMGPNGTAVIRLYGSDGRLAWSATEALVHPLR